MTEIEEFGMPRGSEAERRMMATTGADLIAMVSECAHILGEGSIERAFAVHKDMIRKMVQEATAKTANAVEQVMLYAMLANTLIATAHACVDNINFQCDMLDIENGGADAP